MTTKTDDIKLLPCPFCGGEPHFDHDDNGWNWIECQRCRVATNYRVSAMDDCRPLLAEKWNRRATVEADRQQRGEATAADGMATLRAALAADPDYAWSWHCAVWAAAYDEGLETGAANRAAARLMRAAFDVDTTKNPNFSSAHLMTKKEQQ